MGGIMRVRKILKPERSSVGWGDDSERFPFARVAFIFGIILIIGSLFPSAAAHVPLTSAGNDHIEGAFPVTDPTKSWVVYGDLAGAGDVRYYRMEMAAGDELRLSLFTPDGGAAFVPGLVVMGPGLSSAGTAPLFVEMHHHDDEHRDEEEIHHMDEIHHTADETGSGSGGEPKEYGAVVIKGTVPAGAMFEPFTPSALYSTAAYSHRVTEPGTWYVAVYAPETSAAGGNFGLAIGYREEFTLWEWLLVPFSVAGIHRWEGQSWALILGPLVVTVIAGFGLIYWWRRRGGKAGPVINGPYGWLAVTAGLLYLGTAMMLLVQTLLALAKTGPAATVILPAVYITVAILPGWFALHSGLQSTGWGTKTGGILMIAVGIVGLFLWAGLLAGPACAFAAGVGAIVLGEKRLE
ncbi:hypothetical protein [Methanogenium organophilum]|uniref:Uncharacterized protein n=1 Tax=Methanogenium organophilum TaxID=2199 RepID=A0A9X9S7B0_METOG|nr:hypothetical protein [Methanogenium organophilum]WAI02165.1 hypothetical protein OU421_04650 [Methanogenium organophilum]